MDPAYQDWASCAGMRLCTLRLGSVLAWPGVLGSSPHYLHVLDLGTGALCHPCPAHAPESCPRCPYLALCAGLGWGCVAHAWPCAPCYPVQFI